MGANDNRKARRSRLLKERKAEIESESVGLSEYRKMRLARSLDRTKRSVTVEEGEERDPL